jgi:hypothetical protein
MPDTVMMTEASTAPVYRNRSDQIKDLAAALVKAQAAMEGAKKDASNPHFGSKYADLASVWDAVRKPLTDNDLCIVQFPRTAGNGVEIETTLLHGATGQFMSDVLWVPCGKNDAQGLGSAITYGRRYSLMAVTGIAPEDDDGNAAAASHKPGVSGSAGAGTQFRPERRQQSSWGPGGKQAAIAEAERDGLIDHNRKKGELPKKADEPSPEEERAAKLKSATDKRIKELHGKVWTREQLDKFWTDNAKWREWMADANNEALAEYERFTEAFLDAENNLKPVELA